MEELMPFILQEYTVSGFKQNAFCGFSLGGLQAIDTVWKHADVFSIAGVFSGSLWWRSKSLEDGYNDDRDRIMHQIIRKGNYHTGLRFYFTTGSLDEKADRNNNGVIDSIDDTLDLINELKKIGYTQGDIHYINYEDGRHDVATWGRAMPQFLLWGWGVKQLM
jgi:predicted alpha/beta superfamily hydrolase